MTGRPSGGGRTPEELASALAALRDEMRDRLAGAGTTLGTVAPEHRRSAQNLLDYLTLRAHDLRPVQDDLARLGLSSLGRSEEHVVRSLEQVMHALRVLARPSDAERTGAAVGFGEGRRALERNAQRTLGRAHQGRRTRIMVTLPAAAAEGGRAGDLLAAGMDVARINTAHDDPATWRALAASVRRAAAGGHRECPILADLPGPKLRTGPVAPGPPVVRLRPRRDARGFPVSAARAVLVPPGVPAGLAGGSEPPRLPVPGPWLAGLAAGDEVTLRDTRAAHRVLYVTDVGHGGAEVEVWDTTYVETGTVLRSPGGEVEVGPLPVVEQALELHVGDRLTVDGDLTPASPDRPGGGARCKLRIGCTLPQALAAVAPGDHVVFDDGRIVGIARAAADGCVEVEVTLAPPGGARLHGGRGINLPDRCLDLPAVSAVDEQALDFAAGHADLVGMSFAQRPGDVDELRRRLGGGERRPGIVLKIETAGGFQRLPELLLAGMAWDRLAVMVARGDLAVECGFERLAEVQDEILWLCDAAHVPVIWATQVLDQMARTGQPSRAEVSDAVLAARAECVMLNKGPYIVQAVMTLDDILRRMEAHQRKKAPLLRHLHSWSPEAATHPRQGR